ncbi:hypothetical protein DFJ65_3102 [Calidifontibacter indicus]|uniref:Uncharacterized protein n=1 Tax=Calidifontibacter indicus TaxID=419650 RepID=A0A3D9UVM7_9MICO|nr:hypothetical protein DFJ65_3102 [Calidifontibacter indicus]
MRAVIYARNNEDEVVDRPVPEFGPDEWKNGPSSSASLIVPGW